MDWDLITIFGFVTLMVLIVLPFAYIVNKRVQEHEERKLELEARIQEAKANQTQQAIADQSQLEDRLRVIERIVTDPSADLSRQIENLRELKSEEEKVQ